MRRLHRLNLKPDYFLHGCEDLHDENEVDMVESLPRVFISRVLASLRSSQLLFCSSFLLVFLSPLSRTREVKIYRYFAFFQMIIQAALTLLSRSDHVVSNADHTKSLMNLMAVFLCKCLHDVTYWRTPSL